MNYEFIKNMPIPTTTIMEIRLGDFTEADQKLTHYSPSWGLMEYNRSTCLAHLD